jgi:hypothetical protein
LPFVSMYLFPWSLLAIPGINCYKVLFSGQRHIPIAEVYLPFFFYLFFYYWYRWNSSTMSLMLIEAQAIFVQQLSITFNK